MSDAGNNKKRVLIVDDDPAYARMVRAFIKDIYRADIAISGEQAITFLHKVPADEGVDLILLDCEMPVADGPAVFKMLREDPLTKRIPVVFLTGNATPALIGRIMELEPEGYITKTATREELLGYIADRLL